MELEKDEYKIVQNKKEPTIFTIFFNYYREILIKSFVKTKIITGVTVTDNYTVISFNAKSVKTLKQFQQELFIKNNTTSIPYEVIIKMIHQLSSQLKYLIEVHCKTFIGYNLENVIVIDDTNFIYLPNDDLYNIESEEITITSPFSQNDFFMSPEISIIKEIPSTVHYKSAYYSLGCLIIHCLTSTNEETNEDSNEDENENKETNENMIKILDTLPIKETKLYFFIKRSLLKEPKNRSLLFI
jgi:hypothetical protein